MNIVVFETMLPDTPEDARFFAFDFEAEAGGPTDTVAFAESEEAAVEAFIQLIEGVQI